MSLKEKTSVDAFSSDQAGTDGYTLPQGNGRYHETKLKQLRTTNAQRMYRRFKRITNWTPARRQRALSALQAMRPHKRQVQNYYRERGDAPAVARMLTENYEQLPVVHLTRRDYHVLRDVVNGKSERHRGYIERVLK